jgi:hypothetical protein
VTLLGVGADDRCAVLRHAPSIRADLDPYPSQFVECPSAWMHGQYDPLLPYQGKEGEVVRYLLHLHSLVLCY